MGLKALRVTRPERPVREVREGRYRHYKGQEYEVIAVAKHTETGEYFVVYRALYGDYAIWVRPRDMFLSNVQLNGHDVPRFEYVGRQTALR